MSLFSITSCDGPETGLFEEHLKHDGEKRDYLLYIPEGYDGKEKLPLVFVFHGYTSSAKNILSYVDFRPYADERGLIIVYPEGSLLERVSHWNVGGWTNDSKADDVGFTAAMIDAISKDYAVNLDRVYSTGHSNGGYMSLLLACQMSDRIAAVGSVSGSMTPEMFDGRVPNRPVPVLQIHGDQDEVVFYDGTSWSKPVETTLDYWIKQNECHIEPVVETIPKNEKTTNDVSIEHSIFQNCQNDVVVEHYKAIGGVHAWLNSSDIMGRANWDINTIEVLLDFFEQYDLNGAIK